MILIRYLTSEYLKILILATFSFLAILMTTRLEDIIRFASLGAPLKAIFLYTFYQLPYILPIVIPIAGFIAALILSGRLSDSQELTALRSSGFSLFNVLLPILNAAALLTALNFFIVSEIATTSHLQTKLLQRELGLLNPLSLIHHTKVREHPDLFISAKDRSSLREKIDDFLLAYWDHSSRKIHLFTAESMRVHDEQVQIERGGIIAPLRNDGLYLEDIQKAEMNNEAFSLFLKQKPKRIHEDFLNLSSLMLQSKEKGEWKAGASEVVRRISLALSAFTFTLLGLASGLSIERERSSPITLPLLLCSFFLVSFFLAKIFSTGFFIAALLYLVPQLIMMGISLRWIRRLSEGVTA